MHSRITLLGIPIDAVTMTEAIQILQRFLEGKPTFAHEGATVGKHVMTPNNEMLVEAAKNPAFRDVLITSALNLPDSQGLLFAAHWTGQQLPERVPGVDAVQALCSQLDESSPVFLLGAADGVAECAAKVFRSRNPRLSVVGTFGGSPRLEDAAEIISLINRAQPHLLLVAFGAPSQDLWIAEYLHALPSVRVAMGVGGTFDFIAGVRRRAPRFLRNIGLEWLWRFIQEPSRWRRMWRAVVVFPWCILRYGQEAPR